MIHFPRWKIAAILGVCLIAAIVALPNLFSRATLAEWPTWSPTRQVSLGLDLQGGSHLLLQVDLDAVSRERMGVTAESVRAELRRAQIAYGDVDIQGTKIIVRLREGFDRAKAREALHAADEEIDVQIADDGLATVIKSQAALAKRRDAAVRQSIEIIRRRIDETGTREPNIQQQGQDRILVQLPGVRDPERVKALIGATAKLTFRLVDVDANPADVARGRAPAGSELLPGDRVDSGTGQPIKYAVRRRVMVSGDTLVDAQPSFQDGRAVVSFRFDAQGSRRFADATTENVHKPFAIVLDDKVISAPVINEPITGGRGIISGNFTTQSASDLALLLRAGALPAPLTVIEERSVGPGLGQDSIDAGLGASGIGFVLVSVFLVLVYRLFGLFALSALVVNLVLIIALMSVLQATLTLPGIAGVVLTMGIAVDANVLIFERIREEAKAGRSVIASIDAGFQRAFGTIVDSNLTTLIATGFLFAFGSGPVRGFAVTLTIGILCSMFTAVTLTRLLVATWLKRAKPRAIPL